MTAELEKHSGDQRTRRISFATGRLAYPYIKKYAEQIQKKYPNLEILGYEIRNDFFGELITVSGLLTGQDLMAQLSGKRPGGNVCCCPVIFCAAGKIFSWMTYK